MRRRSLQKSASRRLAWHREAVAEPVAAAQATLWAALKAGDKPEALRQASSVGGLSGRVLPHPMAEVPFERLRRMAGDRAMVRAHAQGAL